MSLDSPRSCGGFCTPRLPADMVGQIDSFLETDVSLENERKVDLKKVCQDAERDTSCGDTRYLPAVGYATAGTCSLKYHENDFGSTLKKQDACYEELLHKVAMLEARLTAETHARHQQNALMGMNERRARDRLAEKTGEIELLRLEKQNAEAECKTLREQLEITSKHLSAVENLFNDAHKKYEKSKYTIHILSRNVEILKKSLAEHAECIRQKQDQFLQLKEHAIEKLNYANVQLDLIQRRHSTESTKLRAALDKAELKAKSTSQQLEYKTKENVDLIRICDSLLKSLDSTSNCSFERLVAEIWKNQQAKSPTA